jgi:hypothetical protein
MRLEFWSALPRDELARRVQVETRRSDLTFAETQMLDAALERLSTWKTPHNTVRRATMIDDTETTNVAPVQPEQTAKAQPKKENTVKKTASKKTASKKTASKKTASKKTAKKVVVKAAKKAAPKTAKKSNGRIAQDAVVRMKASVESPYRPNSEQDKRFQIIKKMSGKTYADIRDRLPDATTIMNLLSRQLISV